MFCIQNIHNIYTFVIIICWFHWKRQNNMTAKLLKCDLARKQESHKSIKWLFTLPSVNASSVTLSMHAFTLLNTSVIWPILPFHTTHIYDMLWRGTWMQHTQQGGWGHSFIIPPVPTPHLLCCLKRPMLEWRGVSFEEAYSFSIRIITYVLLWYL